MGESGSKSSSSRSEDRESVEYGDEAGDEERTGCPGEEGLKIGGGSAMEGTGIMESDGVVREDVLEEIAGEEGVEMSGSQKPPSGGDAIADEEGILTKAPGMGAARQEDKKLKQSH